MSSLEPCEVSTGQSQDGVIDASLLHFDLQPDLAVVAGCFSLLFHRGSGQKSRVPRGRTVPWLFSCELSAKTAKRMRIRSPFPPDSHVISADGRRSALVVVLRRCRQAEPRIHRLLPNRVAGRWKGRGVEGAHRDPADFRVAVSFPIERAAAIRAKVKANAITTVGFALIDLALAFDPHPLFRIGCAEMERGAGSPPARTTVAQIDPLGLTRGDDAKRAAMTLGGPFHPFPPDFLCHHPADPLACSGAVGEIYSSFRALIAATAASCARWHPRLLAPTGRIVGFDIFIPAAQRRAAGGR